mmetsp:Transcript_3800/g.8958  ORF Transcript_3800/g.8958 Transcript_3800/m.8958 type:complete len:269 (+) Transcript_3800:1092-1898(+)
MAAIHHPACGSRGQLLQRLGATLVQLVQLDKIVQSPGSAKKLWRSFGTNAVAFDEHPRPNMRRPPIILHHLRRCARRPGSEPFPACRRGTAHRHRNPTSCQPPLHPLDSSHGKLRSGALVWINTSHDEAMVHHQSCPLRRHRQQSLLASVVKIVKLNVELHASADIGLRGSAPTLNLLRCHGLRLSHPAHDQRRRSSASRINPLDVKPRRRHVHYAIQRHLVQRLQCTSSGFIKTIQLNEVHHPREIGRSARDGSKVFHGDTVPVFNP